MMLPLTLLVTCCLIAATAPIAAAPDNPASGLTVSSLFTDHMVLQRDLPVPVWGKATPGTSVEVSFAGQKQSSAADASGKWTVTLDALAGTTDGSPLVIRTTGDEQISLSDVVVGEVWICSGQSNMQMGRSAVPELKALPATNLRTFQVKRTVAFTEQDAVAGTWTVAGANSAVAFGFSHFLAKQIDVPVGIVLSSWGSTSIEAWMPRDMTRQLPHFNTIMTEWDSNDPARDRIEAALANGKWSNQDDIFMRRQSCIVYNAMMKPLAPFACRGLVWYQGERNTRFMSGMPKSPWYMRVAGIREYDVTLKAWMKRYRREWGRDDLHFLVVMLPGFGKTLDTGPTMDPNHPASHSWAWMRESQLAALDLPHTGVANTIDLGSAKNIHPKDKLPIGRRLALLAARDTLGMDVEASGPVVKSIEAKDDRLIVSFEHARGLQTTDGEAPREFWITDASAEKWDPAIAKIRGETVVLHAPAMARPTYVRYAFTGKPDVNLVNEADLPAVPFRTDTLDP